MCSDHFAPWSARQGHSGFAWSWLGAALATTALPFGVVNAPGQRYHPAIIAQAIGHPGGDVPRALLGGARQRRERPTSTSPATPGPPRTCDSPAERVRGGHPRLLARRGGHPRGLVTVDAGPAVVHCPSTKPRLSPRRSAWRPPRRAARWADGLITVNQAPEQLGEGPRRLPGRRRARQDRAAGAPVLGTDRRRPRRSPGLTQWRSTRRPARWLGPEPRPATSTPRASTSARTSCAGRSTCRPVRPTCGLAAGVRGAGLRRALPAPRRPGAGAFIETFGGEVLPKLREGCHARPD